MNNHAACPHCKHELRVADFASGDRVSDSILVLDARREVRAARAEIVKLTMRVEQLTDGNTSLGREVDTLREQREALRRLWNNVNMSLEIEDETEPNTDTYYRIQEARSCGALESPDGE